MRFERKYKPDMPGVERPKPVHRELHHFHVQHSMIEVPLECRL
jgi:hypothetical protein